MNLLNPSGRMPIVGDVVGFEARVVDEPWTWAERNAGATAEHWDRARAKKPDLFDGRIIVAREVEVEYSTLKAVCCEAPYSALLHWKETGFPTADAFNIFAAGVLVTRDGAALLGRMAPHTANAGQLYFPCGTPDAGDVVDGRLDLEGSILRELEEETGLGSAHVTPSGQRWISWDGPVFCCARRLDTDLSADEVRTIAAAHIAAQPRSELEKVVLLGSLDELGPGQIPAWAVALLSQVLG